MIITSHSSQTALPM